ncbi:MAG: hypothetical protein VYC91_09475, partial [Acidobacteriota bacterium]|nr:hypothetical protein [Acidobacteriota bacterium]
MADAIEPVEAEDQALSESEIIETREWLESIDYVLQKKGPERVRTLLEHLQIHLRQQGVELPFSANTPYMNT